MSSGATNSTNTKAASQGAVASSTAPPSNPTKPPAAKASSWRDLAGLWPYLKRYPGAIALGLLCLLLTSLIGNIIPLTTGVITDVVAGNPRPFQSGTQNEVTGSLAHWIPFYTPHSSHAISIYCLILLVCVLLKGFFSFCTRWILIGVSRDIEFDMRVALFDRLLVMEPEFYVRNRTGELMSRATNDLNNVRMVLGPGIMYTGQTLATMVLALFVLARLSGTLTLWILLPVPIVFVSVRHFGKVIHDLYEKIQASLAALSSKVQENLTGVRVVRAYAQEEAEIRGFDEPNREYVARNIKLIRTWSMFMPSLQALIGTSFLIVLWKGGQQLLSGQITLGALIAFYTYLGLLVWPMIALGWVTNIFQRGAASTGRLNYILRAKPQIDDGAATIAKQTKVAGEIEFRDLTFTYPTNLAGNAANPMTTAAAAGNTNGSGAGANANTAHPVLRNISLKIAAGSTLAIVGPTGSGKTTLASLIARLWEAPNGQLFIDGHPIREWPLENLRRAIGYVPQDTYLFSETVGGNIAFGLTEYGVDQIGAAAEIANLDADIESFSNKYDTVVGERGVTLSGGQKQRSAIARAVIRDPRILILDDSLSAVDTQTEERILTRLRGVMEGRTTILISHRISTVQNADQIIVLRDGKIIERGTHDQLLTNEGYYADLHRKQLLEEELENV
jgi:ATP-binding cassette, subfamily B, multidrug efflux pump